MGFVIVVVVFSFSPFRLAPFQVYAEELYYVT